MARHDQDDKKPHASNKRKFKHSSNYPRSLSLQTPVPYPGPSSIHAYGPERDEGCHLLSPSNPNCRYQSAATTGRYDGYTYSLGGCHELSQTNLTLLNRMGNTEPVNARMARQVNTSNHDSTDARPRSASWQPSDGGIDLGEPWAAPTGTPLGYSSVDLHAMGAWAHDNTSKDKSGKTKKTSGKR